MRSVLRPHADIEIIGEAENGIEACSCVERLQPSLILMDINMPKMNGIDATRWIKERHPEVVVIGLTVNDDEVTMALMRQAGATSVVNKETVVDDLYPAIKSLDWKIEATSKQEIPTILGGPTA
jgi:DNA-binding NarL/FixJ family response regulator